jgi:hypothetical protein
MKRCGMTVVHAVVVEGIAPVRVKASYASVGSPASDRRLPTASRKLIMSDGTLASFVCWVARVRA